MQKKIVFFLYGCSVFFLFLYSFTQIDLGLTLTRYPFWQPIQHAFQYVGYFNRPLSTALFSCIIFLFFLSYILLFRLALAKQLNRKEVWILITCSIVVLSFSYNVLSYDLFNYMFDAKIFTYYHQNPYLQKALDFPGDPMLAFMHWTHRTYPYGPSWLLISVVLSYAGMQLLLPTFLLFKLLFAVAFLGTIYYLEKILMKYEVKDLLPRVVLFAANPFILLETIVSGHHDMVMLLFAIMSIYYFLEKRYIISFCLFLFSAGIKFVTLLLVPAYYFLAK
jgi:hypothetical protein